MTSNCLLQERWVYLVIHFLLLHSSDTFASFSYIDYDAMVDEITLLPSSYPGCARVYDALDRWGDQFDLNV